MPQITILTEAELRACVPLDAEAVDVVEGAFRALATKPVAMPPILRLDIPEHKGEVDVKTAYVPGLDGFAIKISPGFFDNPKLGLPSVNGLMVLLSARTGLVEALLLDNGYLTDVRTAAAGAVAAKWLSRAECRVTGVLGAGVQARLQLQALMLVRPITEAVVWARDALKAERFASETSQALSLPIHAARSAREVVEAAEIIVTTTPATAPLVEAEWLRPGQHLTAMGSDAEHKNEIAPAALARADLYVADRLSQTLRLGELHHAVEAGAISCDTPLAELGDIVAGRHPGRIDDAQITLCDLTGTGVQDTAIATVAHRRARDARLGTIFTS